MTRNQDQNCTNIQI